MAEGCPRQGGGEGACGCGRPPGRYARRARCVRSSKPGSVGRRRWVWAASSLGHEARVGPQRLTSPSGGPGAAKEVGWRPVREQEPADALGMPPAPLSPVMQFFIVGGLAVPPPLPADRKLGIRGLAPAERGGQDRASSLSACCRPRSRLEFLVSTTPPPPGPGERDPAQPCRQQAAGGPRGGPVGGRGVPSLCLRSGLRGAQACPAPRGLCFLSLQQACHQLGPWGAALGHSSIATCGAGPGPWNPGQASVTRPASLCRFPGPPAPPRVPSSSARGAGLSLGRRRRHEGFLGGDTMPGRAARGTWRPHSRGRGTPFTLAGSPPAALHPGSLQAQAPPPPPQPSPAPLPGARILASLPLRQQQ